MKKNRTLIIAEKPSAAREIAAALGALTRKTGYLESDLYTVSWAAGHLVTLKEPHEYKEEWKKWVLATLPILPERFELKVIETAKAQYTILKKLLKSKDFKQVVNACDAGREGELIFDNIYRLSGSQLPAFRLWTSAALTPEAIKREFERLKPAEHFHGLRLAARARAAADWTIGMNATRAISLKAQSQGTKQAFSKDQKSTVFSVGRVQTPTLQFLVSREEDIKRFISKPFWTLTATVLSKKAQPFLARYEFKSETGFTHQILDETKAQNIIATCQGQPATVVKADAKDQSTPPPLLFDLTELQKECNKKFGLSADETLAIAQTLYERHKAISYPRTEYRHLTEDNRKTLPGVLQALKNRFSDLHIDKALERHLAPNKRIFDNAKVGDHHALIPTATSPQGLSDQENAVYTLIVKRFLAVFQDDFKFQSSIIALLCENQHLFVARGKTITQQGWKALEQDLKKDTQDPADQNQTLPQLAVNDRIKIDKISKKSSKTEPPPRHTDATLLAAMQNPGSKTDDQEEKDALRSCGLGTPATRASIIKKLEHAGYIKRSKKQLVPTDKAFELMALLKSHKQDFLSNPVMTAEWEKHLQEIEKDHTKALFFINHLKTLTGDIVSSMKTA